MTLMKKISENTGIDEYQVQQIFERLVLSGEFMEPMENEKWRVTWQSKSDLNVQMKDFFYLEAAQGFIFNLKNYDKTIEFKLSPFIINIEK